MPAPTRARRVQQTILLLAATSLACTHGAPTPNPKSAASSWPVYTLQPDAAWQLNLPDLEPFEASGLVLTATNSLLTINNRGPEIYQVRLPDSADSTGSADLAMDLNAFPESQLHKVAPIRNNRYDIEGIALDARGRLYLCEESQRWILRWDPALQQLDRLPIDWTPVRQFFSPTDPNASFEGLAVDHQTLYVANERQQGRIIAVSLDSLEIVKDFEVRTHKGRLWDNHYSDLCSHRHRLYVLCRDSRAVLRVNPTDPSVEAEYDFSSIERNPEWRYRTVLPFVGIMEGLAVTDDHFWLVTDNNNLPREQFPNDRRPTLFRCPRPDRTPLPPPSKRQLSPDPSVTH